MKTFTRILKILAVIILLIVVSGLLFFPSASHIERSVEIKKSPEATYAYLADLKNFNAWSPWYKLDPNGKYEFENGTTSIGSRIKWDSKNFKVGKGSMVLSDLKPDSIVRMDLDMSGNKAQAYYSIVPTAEGSKVIWAFDADAGMNPVMRIMSKLMRGMLEDVFDSGLTQLKKNLESMPDVASYQIEEVKISQTYFMYVHDSAAAANIGEHLGKDYGMIGQASGKQKLTMTGAPFAIYYNGGTEAWAFDAGAPFDKKGKDDGVVKAGERHGGNAVLVHYYGPYMGVSKAHAQAHEYITKNNKKITGAPWESYVTDPMTEKDTMKWKTEVYYPVE
jgi:effector-binding domain-containing protein